MREAEAFEELARESCPTHDPAASSQKFEVLSMERRQPTIRASR